MAQQVQVCDIDADLIAKMKKFKFANKTNVAAIIIKIKKGVVVEDEEYEDISIEELQNELPDSQPCYVLLRYVHKKSDGRMTYPLCFIYVSPDGCKPELNMMYAGTKLALVDAAKVTKVFDIRSKEDFTDEFIVDKLV